MARKRSQKQKPKVVPAVVWGVAHESGRVFLPYPESQVGTEWVARRCGPTYRAAKLVESRT